MTDPATPHSIHEALARLRAAAGEADGAVEALYAAATLADAPLPYDFVLSTEGAPHNPSLINPAAAFFAATATMDPLATSGLLEADAGAQTFRVPPEVRDAVLESLTDEQRREWGGRAVYALNLALPDADAGDWDAVERLLPHIEVCRTLVDELDLHTPAANRLLHQTGIALHHQGRHLEAAEYLDHALKVDLALKGPGHPDVAADLEGLGIALWAAGDLQRAEEAFLRCLEFQRNIFTEDNPALAATHNSLGVIRQTLGRFDEAEADLGECLRILIKAHGETHPSVASCLGNLSLLQEAAGRPGDALRSAERALAVTRAVQGETHPDAAAYLNTVALLREALGDHDGAERDFRESLDVRRAAYGEAHPETAQSYCNLALLLHNHGGAEAAMELYDAGLDAYEAALGPGHPMLEHALDNCVELLERVGTQTDSPLRRKAVERLQAIVSRRT